MASACRFPASTAREPRGIRTPREVSRFAPQGVAGGLLGRRPRKMTPRTTHRPTPAESPSPGRIGHLHSHDLSLRIVNVTPGRLTVIPSGKTIRNSPQCGLNSIVGEGRSVTAGGLQPPRLPGARAAREISSGIRSPDRSPAGPRSFSIGRSAGRPPGCRKPQWTTPASVPPTGLAAIWSKAARGRTRWGGCRGYASVGLATCQMGQQVG